MEAERKQVPVGLRVAPWVASWLKKEADANHRSVSAQVSYLLEQKMKEANEKTPA